MISKSKRFKAIAIITGVFTTILALLFWFGFDTLVYLETYTYDLRVQMGRTTPLHKDLVLIGIDQQTYEQDLGPEDYQREPLLKELTQWPWSRSFWATLVERLVKAGAKVVALDLIFASETPGDVNLHALLEKYPTNVVLGMTFTKRNEEAQFAITGPNPSIIGDTAPEAHPNVGFVNFFEMFDGAIRQAKFRFTETQFMQMAASVDMAETYKPGPVSFVGRMLELTGRSNAIPTGYDQHFFRFTSPPEKDIKAIPVRDIFLYWETNFVRRDFFKGKYVVVGPTASVFQDIHKTPYPVKMPGPELHMQVLNSALQREFLKSVPRHLDLLLVIAGGLLAVPLALFMHHPLKRLFGAGLLAVGYLAICQIYYDGLGIILVATAPILLLGNNTVVILVYDIIVEQLDKARVRRTLERYVSRDVVKEVLDNPDSFLHSLVGVRKPVTILFSDVRNFTTITESADPAVLVKQLNEYFDEMVNIVFEHHGRLDKFIGDAVMADWGSIVTHGAEKDACNAVTTALAMKRSLASLNNLWKPRGMLELSFGIGINQGDVITGNLGSVEKMEVSVIGDAVNLASRLEGLTKDYKTDLLIGETVAPLVRDHFILRTVDFVRVKGKTKPVEIFTVLGEKREGEGLPGWLIPYEEGVQLFRKRKFTEAIAKFEESLEQHPHDYLCGEYVKECQSLIQNPPDEKWDAVRIFTKK